MPHKHRRKVAEPSAFNLAPSSAAAPLPVRSATDPDESSKASTGKRTKTSSSAAVKKKKRKRNADDDTPKAFVRLMQYQSTGRIPNGLDNGRTLQSKKQKDQATPTMEPQAQQPIPELSIMPGERMSEFSARVNHALPLAGITQKGKKVDGIKEKVTKLERRITKRQDAWRREHAQRLEREEEAREAAEEQAEEEGGGVAWNEVLEDTLRQARGGGRKKARKADDDDPWRVLKATREKPKGLHDVVQAPPEFRVVPKEKFKVRGGARVEVENVPRSAGSLKQREELGATRKAIIARYRAMMDGT